MQEPRDDGRRRNFSYYRSNYQTDKPQEIPTDVFSLGDTVRQLFINPTVDTDLSKTTLYTQMIQTRAEERETAFKAHFANKFNGNPSALSDPEFQKLQDVDAELANVVRDLMLYDPKQRADLSKLEEVLQRIAKDGPQPIFREVMSPVESSEGSDLESTSTYESASLITISESDSTTSRSLPKNIEDSNEDDSSSNTSSPESP